MLALFRGFLSTWAARVFFLLLVGSFVLWGVGDVVRNLGGDTAVALVGRERIEPQQLQDAYRNQLAQVTRMTGGREPTAEEKTRVAQLTLEQLVQNALVGEQARGMGVAAPDEAVRDTVFAIPAFRGPGGQFDRNALSNWMRQNNMTEPRLLAIIRDGLLRDQLVESVRAGVAAPGVLVNRVFAFQNETRVAEMVELPFDAAPEPPAPTEADLHRLYDNNPGAYTAPAFRRVRVVLLSPDTVAREMDVSDAEIAAAYEAQKPQFVAGEKRALQVVVAPDEAVARKLTEQWRGGADWAAMEAAAKDAGATAIDLPDSAPDEFPTAELREAAFAATPDAITGPVSGPAGWQVLRVTHVTPAHEETLAQAHDTLREQIARQKAVEQLPDRRRRLEDEISAVTSLEALPTGLGVVAAVGTMDAAGNTADGEPAPLPGTPAVRQAIVTAAFATEKGALPVLTPGPDQSLFALTVEDSSAPVQKPFEAVEAQLRADYETQERRRTEEQAAAKLLTAARAAGSLDDAATVADLRVVRTPALHRGAPAEGVPPELLAPLFNLKLNEPTMVQSGDAFYVAAPVEITAPEPSSDPAGADRIRTSLNRALGDDVEITYVNALRGRAEPRVNRQMFEQATQ